MTKLQNKEAYRESIVSYRIWSREARCCCYFFFSSLLQIFLPVKYPWHVIICSISMFHFFWDGYQSLSRIFSLPSSFFPLIFFFLSFSFILSSYPRPHVFHTSHSKNYNWTYLKLWYPISNATHDGNKFRLTRELFQGFLKPSWYYMIRCEILELFNPLIFFVVARYIPKFCLWLSLSKCIVLVTNIHTYLRFCLPPDLWPQWSVHLGLGNGCTCSPSFWLVPDLEWQSAHTQLLGEFFGSLSLSGDWG